MPLASQKRVEGVSRLGRDSVAFRSRRCRKRREKPTSFSRFGCDWVAIGRVDVEDKTQKKPDFQQLGNRACSCSTRRAFLCFC